jgi:predicted permease
MTLWSDICLSLRQLRKSPGFTATVLGTLGLCIGANTAIYSVVDAVLIQPLPYPEADRLGSLARHVRSGNAESVQFNVDGTTWQAVYNSATKIDVAAEGSLSGVNLAAGNRIEYVQQQRVSSGYFHVLGVLPQIGREFDKLEDTAGGPTAALLSYELWQNVFHGEAGVVGRSIDLRGEPFTVVGVMPKSFVNKDKADLWTPLRPSTTGEGSGTNYSVFARLKPGVTWNEASAEVRALEQPVLNAQLVQWHSPSGVTADMRLVSLQRALTDQVRSSVLPKWGAVVLILLIGCVNIAGLLIAQSASRRRETATRMALGASRGRIVSRLLTESVLLALGGGAIGIALASVVLTGLKRFGMEGFDLWRPVTLDARVLLMTLVISLATSIIFGLIPALETSRLDIRSVLLEGGRGTPGRGQRRMRQVLVAGEIALGLVLLASAGLLIRTLAYLEGLEPGFDPHHVLVAQLSLQDARYQTSAKVNSLFQKSLERIRALPGVESAAVGLSLPYQRPLNEGFRILDGPNKNTGSITEMILVTPGYFETLRMKVKGGRTFADYDSAVSQPVAIVNQAFVRKYLHQQSPLGTHLSFGATSAEIVGLVADAPQHSGAGNFGPLAATPTVYLPDAQTGDEGLSMLYTWFSPNWVVRTRGVSPNLIGEMQAAIQAIDPRLPFSNFKSMEEYQTGSLASQRYEAMLFSVFAALALLLAGVGVYGLVANSVTQRTREIGIRVALGASARDAIRSIVTPSLKLAAIGAAIGLVLTWFASRLLQSLIWGVQTHDAPTYIFVTATMFAIAAVASLLPALRLIKLDPVVVLREE